MIVPKLKYGSNSAAEADDDCLCPGDIDVARVKFRASVSHPIRPVIGAESDLGRILSVYAALAADYHPIARNDM